MTANPTESGGPVRSTRASAQRLRSRTIDAGSPLVIELPFPDSKLNPNGRHHYLVKNAAFQQAKDEAVVAIRTQWTEPGVPLPVRIVLHFRCPSKQRRDLDNLVASIKPYIDALVHCRVIEDDNDVIEIHARKSVDRANPGLTLEVHPCDG